MKHDTTFGYDAPISAAREWLLESGFRAVSERVIGSGFQAIVTIICGEDRHGVAQQYVLKAFNGRYGNTGSAIAHEYATLAAFHAALRASESGVKCPRPIRLLDHVSAYLMEYAPGETLADHLDRSRTTLGDLPERIVAGLAIYHRAFGSPYGDLSPTNILVDRERDNVHMIDPTYAKSLDLSGVRSDHGPLSIDLAYWLNNAVSFEVRRLLHVSRRARWRNFTRLLLRAAMRTEGAPPARQLLRDVESVTMAFLEQSHTTTGVNRNTLVRLKVLMLRHVIGAVKIDTPFEPQS